MLKNSLGKAIRSGSYITSERYSSEPVEVEILLASSADALRMTILTFPATCSFLAETGA
jgi:hypothetical protein